MSAFSCLQGKFEVKTLKQEMTSEGIKSLSTRLEEDNNIHAAVNFDMRANLKFKERSKKDKFKYLSVG